MIVRPYVLVRAPTQQLPVVVDWPTNRDLDRAHDQHRPPHWHRHRVFLERVLAGLRRL